VQAKAMLADYYVGELVVDAGATTTAAGTSTSSPAAPTTAVADPITLNPRAKVTLKLAERIEVSHNTRIFRFALPSPQHRLGLPTGLHVLVYGKVTGESVARAYTPISCDDDVGRLDLLIKVQAPALSPYLHL
jgi:nitrate reductase (NAD(P)H)